MIDHECRTNDPYIYAAGTLTKYSRRYLARTKSHKYYNRIEIGQRLGLAVKRMLSPKTVSVSIQGYDVFSSSNSFSFDRVDFSDNVLKLGDL